VGPLRPVPGGRARALDTPQGIGSFDATTGAECGRISVVLATGIPEERCRRLNLRYMDPASIDVNAWRGRESEGVVVIDRAGEQLYRLRPSTTVETVSAAGSSDP
jgi:hypothetical protein